MKRTLKILGYLILTLILLVGIGASFIWFRGIPTYKADIPPQIASLQVPRDSALVERGAKIATLLCNECHRGEDGKLTGRQMKDLPTVFGTVYSMNITQEHEHGIGKWTDGELYYFLRTGIHTDGRWSPPYMPKFPLMADEDVYSIIAWLRSNDPSLAADSREYPPNKPNFFYQILGEHSLFSSAVADTANCDSRHDRQSCFRKICGRRALRLLRLPFGGFCQTRRLVS
jgi:cytochrome c2